MQPEARQRWGGGGPKTARRKGKGHEIRCPAAGYHRDICGKPAGYLRDIPTTGRRENDHKRTTSRRETGVTFRKGAGREGRKLSRHFRASGEAGQIRYSLGAAGTNPSV